MEHSYTLSLFCYIVGVICGVAIGEIRLKKKIRAIVKATRGI